MKDINQSIYFVLSYTQYFQKTSNTKAEHSLPSNNSSSSNNRYINTQYKPLTPHPSIPLLVSFPVPSVISSTAQRSLQSVSPPFLLAAAAVVLTEAEEERKSRCFMGEKQDKTRQDNISAYYCYYYLSALETLGLRI